MKSDEDFQTFLQQDFLEEAEDLVNKIVHAFSVLDEDNTRTDMIDQAFRFCHTLKGSAKTVGFYALGNYAHKYENILTSVRDGSLDLSEDLLRILIEGNDFFLKFIEELRVDPTSRVDVSSISKKLSEYEGVGASDPSEKVLSSDVSSVVEEYKAMSCHEKASNENNVPEVTAETEDSKPVVLLVDDEEDIREIMQEIIEDLGVKVIPAENGQEALSQIAKGTIPNLIFTDLNMPKMTGIELVENVRKTIPEVPVIICSGFADREDIINFMNQGAFGFLDKPVDSSQVERMILSGLREKLVREKLQNLVVSSNRAFMKLIKVTSKLLTSEQNEELKSSVKEIEKMMKEIGVISRDILNS